MDTKQEGVNVAWRLSTFTGLNLAACLGRAGGIKTKTQHAKDKG